MNSIIGETEKGTDREHGKPGFFKRLMEPDEVGDLRPRRKGDYVRFADGVFCSAVFILIFALFCSARVGYFLLIALFVAPGVSVLWAFLSSLFTEVTFPPGQDGLTVSKKDTIKYSFEIRNHMLLPTSLIRICPVSRPNIEMSDRELVTSVISFGKKRVELPFSAVMCGEARLEIKGLCVEDFFGIARFPIKKISGDPVAVYGVLPEIPEISAKDPVLEEAMRAAFSDDNSDDSIDITGYNLSGFPGYDYREYVPGDPLKRINSKLSAKRDTLMVRLDEKNVTAGVVFLLDSKAPDNYETNPLIPGAVENLIETSLGMARTLLSRDFSVTFFLAGDDGWNEETVRTERELGTLAGKLAFFSVRTPIAERIPERLNGIGSSIICFSVCADAALYEELSAGAMGETDGIRVYNAVTGEGRGL